MFEAGVLDDDKLYSIQLGFFFTLPVGKDTGLVQICDGTYCVGFHYRDPNNARAYAGTNSASQCLRDETSSDVQAPQSSGNWNVRLEIHPNSTSGITYVSTNSITYEYSQTLKPSRGLRFKVCRKNTADTPLFHLFELAAYLNE